MLSERAAYNYGELKRNCAESVVMAANDIYNLGIRAEDIELFRGFGGGMGFGGVCGAASGALVVLSRLYKDMEKESFKALCAGFMDMFKEEMGTLDCYPLKEKYHTEDRRCEPTVKLAAAVLEKYLAGLKSEESKEITVSSEDIKRVKGLGFLHHKGTDRFNGRIITGNGRITADECRTISEAAALYGDGNMMFTTRMTVEVSGIEYKNIEPFREYISKAGLKTGGTGSKVRPIVSCKGTTCQYGLYDTYDLSMKAHERFYEGYNNVSLPHKFKIAFGGCPNNCVKPNLNDVGVIGALVPNYNEDQCKGCKKCQIEQVCPVNAAKMENGKLMIDEEKCNNCGRCVGKCPFKCASSGQYGYRVYIGGRWGKKTAEGKMLNRLFVTEAETLETIEKSILFFRKYGVSGERFADTINRIGFEETEKIILSDELIKEKNQILGINVKGGATC